MEVVGLIIILIAVLLMTSHAPDRNRRLSHDIATADKAVMLNDIIVGRHFEWRQH